MSEIEIFSYVVILISGVGITLLLWREVRRSEREVLEEQSRKKEVKDANAKTDEIQTP